MQKLVKKTLVDWVLIYIVENQGKHRYWKMLPNLPKFYAAKVLCYKLLHYWHIALHSSVSQGIFMQKYLTVNLYITNMY